MLKMKLREVVLCVLLFHCFVALAGDENYKMNLNKVDVYQSEWQTFLLSNAVVGTKIEELDGRMRQLSSEAHKYVFGGTGTWERIYMVDDFIQIRVVVSREGIILEQPKIEKRGKWRRYPSGDSVEEGN